jgi:hypothetical protein
MRLGIGLLVVALCGGSAVPAAAEVRLSIRDGRVSLTATGATVREILAEWARVGQTKIVNGEKVPGTLVTLQLTDEPEDRALETILRSISGYVAAPRQTVAANASRYDRIVVIPTSAAPRNASPPPATFQAPQPVFRPQRGFQPPPGFQQPMPDAPFAQPVPVDDLEPPFPGPEGSPGVAPNPRGPVFNSFPPPANAPEPQPAQSAPGFAFPAPGRGPVGVSVPGMIVQPPQPPPGAAPPVPPQ